MAHGFFDESRDASQANPFERGSASLEGSATARVARGRLGAITVGLALILSFVSEPAGAAAVPAYPVNWNIVTAFATGELVPAVAPPGANVAGCRVSR